MDVQIQRPAEPLNDGDAVSTSLTHCSDDRIVKSPVSRPKR